MIGHGAEPSLNRLEGGVKDSADSFCSPAHRGPTEGEIAGGKVKGGGMAALSSWTPSEEGIEQAHGKVAKPVRLTKYRQPLRVPCHGPLRVSTTLSSLAKEWGSGENVNMTITWSARVLTVKDASGVDVKIDTSPKTGMNTKSG